MKELSLPLPLINDVEAKAGTLLVERLEMPAKRGSILLPFATREYNRAAEGIIRSSGVSPFLYGQVIVMASSVSRFMHFGDRDERRTLWVVTPKQVLMVLDEIPEEAVQVADDHWQRNITSEQYEAADVEGVAEGEAWGSQNS